MKLEEAQELGLQLMREHGLLGAGWIFGFDRSRRRFGVCIPEKKRIQLSRVLTLLNETAPVRETILHEIAHALAYLRYQKSTGHDRRWREIAITLGASPVRCYDAKLIDTPELPYLVKCERHGVIGQRARRWKGQRSCSRCHRGFNPAYAVELTPNPACT